MFRYAKEMDDTKSQLGEKKLQKKIAAEFEKMITAASSDVGISLVNPITEMFSFVDNIRLN